MKKSLPIKVDKSAGSIEKKSILIFDGTCRNSIYSKIVLFCQFYGIYVNCICIKETTRLIQQLEKTRKSPKILKESLSDTKPDIDKGTILDEKNLIGNEKA